MGMCVALVWAELVDMGLDCLKLRAAVRWGESHNLDWPLDQTPGLWSFGK